MKAHCRNRKNGVISSDTREKVQRYKPGSNRAIFKLRAVASPILYLAVEESRAVYSIISCNP